MRLLKNSRLVWGVLVLVSLSLAACQQTRETRVELEVTRVVTQQVEVTRMVVVTATPFGMTPEVTEAPSATSTETSTETPEQTDDVGVAATDTFPTPVTASIIVAEQEFQNGRMYWLEPDKQIFVLIYADDSHTQGRWSFYEDTWQEGEPESDPNLEASIPEGLQQPVRGFGKLWRENPAIQEALGWALDAEYGYWTDYEYVFGGTMNEGTYVPDAGEHRFRAKEGGLLIFDEADGTWTLTASQGESTEEANSNS